MIGIGGEKYGKIEKVFRKDDRSWINLKKKLDFLKSWEKLRKVEKVKDSWEKLTHQGHW